MLAISEAICRHRAARGHRRAAVRGPGHARAVRARVPLGARGVRRPRAWTRAWTPRTATRPRPRSRTRSSPTTAATARGPTASCSRPRTTRRRTAATSTTRRAAGRPTPPSPRASRTRPTRSSTDGLKDVRRGDPADDALRLPRRLRRRPARTSIDLDAIREAGVRIGADPLGGASVAYFERIAERPRARPGRGQHRGRPDLPLRPARPRRQDPHGLLLAVRDGRADRAARPLRRRRGLRPGRRPPRDRHARAG